MVERKKVESMKWFRFLRREVAFYERNLMELREVGKAVENDKLSEKEIDAYFRRLIVSVNRLACGVHIDADLSVVYYYETKGGGLYRVTLPKCYPEDDEDNSEVDKCMCNKDVKRFRVDETEYEYEIETVKSELQEGFVTDVYYKGLSIEIGELNLITDAIMCCGFANTNYVPEDVLAEYVNKAFERYKERAEQDGLVIKIEFDWDNYMHANSLYATLEKMWSDLGCSDSLDLFDNLTLEEKIELILMNKFFYNTVKWATVVS